MHEAECFEVAGIVSRETVERLQLLEHLVQKWTPAINLVSKDSLGNLRQRHIFDSIQLFRLVPFEKGVWCDLGSGGGFPGLVIAIMARERDAERQVKLVESDGRKATFLREAVRQLEVEATVINARIEDIPPLAATILSARALAPLPKLCEFALRHLAPGGCAVFPKGETHQNEISEARKSWFFDLTLHPSKTESTAAILELRNLRHV